MVKVAHRGALFDDIANNFAASHESGLDLLLLGIIRTDCGDEDSWANVVLRDKRFLRSSAGYADIAGANMACQVINSSNRNLQDRSKVALKGERILVISVVGEHGLKRKHP